jgi:hypothetical protein
MPDQVRHDGEWQNALAAFRRAEADLPALEGDPDEDAFGDALERFNEALAGLLAVPAPDVRALATKLDLAIAAEVQELSFGPPALAALARDAHRLS